MGEAGKQSPAPPAWGVGLASAGRRERVWVCTPTGCRGPPRSSPGHRATVPIVAASNPAFSTEGDFCPLGTVAMPGDIFGCHN